MKEKSREVSLYPIFLRAERTARGYRVGFMDSNGRTVIAPIFDDAYPFSEGLAAVLNGNLWGYIDVFGDMVIHATLDSGDMFSEGRARDRRGKLWGYIDKSGSCVTEAQYEVAGSFQNGFAWAVADGCFGFVNRDGERVIPFEYDEAREFSEGVAPVRIGERWGYIRPDCTFDLAPRPVRFAGPFHDGLARYETDTGWGFINREGEVVIEPTFDVAYDFHEGLAAVKRNDIYTYINTDGGFVTDFSFSYASSFSEGLAAVEKKGAIGFHNRGFIDVTGRGVIPPRFGLSRRFRNGRCYVETSDEIGYINREGEFVWRAPYVELRLVHDLRL